MQTTLLGLAIGLILALVAALVGPYFVDWNQFRPQFEMEATRVVGAPVRVSGALDARLLPSPSLRLQSVTVGSPNDLSRIRADNLDVEFSLSALMRGEWRATELTIGGAAVDLGLDAQGRIDLPASTGPFNLGALAIDRLNVTGRIALHDAASRSTLELNDIAFSGDVRSLAAGAMRGDGNFTLSGARYPFRISSGQTGDGNGTRMRLTIDPGDKPLSIDLDGVLTIDRRLPRFDGIVTLASPIGLKLKDANDKIPAPWRVSAKIKADPAMARFEAVDASYGSDNSALKFTGLADLRFGASPFFHAVLSAKQLDLDRVLSKGNAMTEPVAPWPALRKLTAAIPQPPLATQLDVSVEQLMLGGRPVQNIGAELRSNATSWSVGRLELRAPGLSRVMLSGSAAQAGEPDAFKGAIDIESTDPDTLTAWLKGRSDVTFRNQKPLRIRGNINATVDHWSIDSLNAEVDGSTLQGRVAYTNASATGGSRLDADLKAEKLDFDATAALIRSLSGPQAEWPDASQLSLNIGRATSAGQDMRPFVAQFGYGPQTISLQQLKIGEASGLKLEGSGSFDRIEATGQLALEATSASLTQLASMVAPLAPAVASRLNAVAPMPGLVRVKLSLNLAKDQQRADHANARAVIDVDGPQIKGTTAITATSPLAAIHGIDLDTLSRSEIVVDQKLTGQGQQLLALLGLRDVIAASDAPVNIEGSATGSWRAPLRLKLKLSGTDLDVDVQGDAEPWGVAPKATLALAVRRANLAPLFDLKSSDQAARDASLSSRVTWNGDKLTFEDIDSMLAGTRIRGRIGFALGSEKTVDGQLGMDTIELAPALSMVIGARARDVTEPLGRGMLRGWRGQLAFQALRGTLPGGSDVRPISGVVKSDGQSVAIDGIKGKIGGGDFSADLDVKQSPAGYMLGARVEWSAVDGSSLRYRSLMMPEGKTSLRMTLASQGRSASALQGALSGNGLLTIDAARIAGLDPHAFDVAIRASDTGQATDDARLRQIVEPALSAGALTVGSVQVPFSIKDSRLRVSATTLNGEGARAIVSGGYDMIADQVDIRVGLTETAVTASSIRPEIQIFAVGPPDRLDRNVDIAALSSWLAVRAIDRETRRLDSLERGAAPTVPAAIPPAAAVEQLQPPAAIDSPTSSAPTVQDIPMPGRDSRRLPAKATAPRPPTIAPTSAPPVVGQQMPPLPAPIEVRPAPGAARAPAKPRLAPPLVLTPPAANSSRPTL